MGEVLAATNRPLIVAGGTRRTIRAWPSLPARAGETPAGRADHAAAEEGVRLRDIAEAIGRGLKIPAVSISPEEAPAHFGWMSMFAAHGIMASSALTRKRLGWQPTGPRLIADLEQMRYFETDTVGASVVRRA